MNLTLAKLPRTRSSRCTGPRSTWSCSCTWRSFRWSTTAWGFRRCRTYGHYCRSHGLARDPESCQWHRNWELWKIRLCVSYRSWRKIFELVRKIVGAICGLLTPGPDCKREIAISPRVSLRPNVFWKIYQNSNDKMKWIINLDKKSNHLFRFPETCAER